MIDRTCSHQIKYIGIVLSTRATIFVQRVIFTIELLENPSHTNKIQERKHSVLGKLEEILWLMSNLREKNEKKNSDITYESALHKTGNSNWSSHKIIFLYTFKKSYCTLHLPKNYKLAVKKNINHYHVFMVYAFGSFFVTRSSSFQQLNPANNKGVNH